jgi:hypothetical protein
VELWKEQCIVVPLAAAALRVPLLSFAATTVSSFPLPIRIVGLASIYKPAGLLHLSFLTDVSTTTERCRSLLSNGPMSAVADLVIVVLWTILQRLSSRG